MKQETVITKALLLGMQRRCLDKLDSGSEHERNLARYEFENRLRDALRAHTKGKIRIRGFEDQTMDVVAAAALRLSDMLDASRDHHDERTAYQVFETKVFDAIRDELKADEVRAKTQALVADVLENPATKPAPAPAAPAPAPTPAPAPPPVAADHFPRRTVEMLDRQVVPDENPVVPDENPEEVIKELARALATPVPLRPDPVMAAKLETVPAASPYSQYERKVTEAWKQPAPPPPKRKKGAKHGNVFGE